MEKLIKLGIGNVPTSPKYTKPVVQEDINKVIDKVNDLVDDLVEINNEATTTYTLKLADANKYIIITHANPITLTVPLNSSVAFPIGTMVTVEQGGAGAITATEVVGVTINGNVLSSGQYNILILVKTLTDTWTCIGGTV